MDAKTLQIITSKSQADKAINSLKGILLGINLDNRVNVNEVNELKNWAKKHNDLVNRNPFKEFMTIIENISIEDLTLTETIEDLFWLCQKYEGNNYYYNAVTADLQTLQGICHGILSDGEINETEIYDLHKWLQENEHLNSYYPYDEIRSLVLSIVSDNKVTEEEVLVLKAYFNQFVTINDKAISDKIKSETVNINISGLCTSEPNIEFVGKTFGFGFVINSNEKLPFQTRSSSMQVEDFKSIPALRKKIIDPEFRLLVNKIESRCGYYLYVMQTAKELNTRLLSQLNKKEF